MTLCSWLDGKAVAAVRERYRASANAAAVTNVSGDGAVRRRIFNFRTPLRVDQLTRSPTR
jgi:hypothetical protein